jgi:hypothetical protein
VTTSAFVYNSRFRVCHAGASPDAAKLLVNNGRIGYLDLPKNVSALSPEPAPGLLVRLSSHIPHGLCLPRGVRLHPEYTAISVQPAVTKKAD